MQQPEVLRPWENDCRIHLCSAVALIGRLESESGPGIDQTIRCQAAVPGRLALGFRHASRAR